MSKPVRLNQTFFDLDVPQIRMLLRHESDLAKLDPEDRELLLRHFLEDTALGLSPGYSSSGYLVALAVAGSRHTLVIELYSSRPKREAKRDSTDRNLEGRRVLESILCRPVGRIFAFDFAPLAMSLYSDLGLRVNNGIDIQDVFAEATESRHPLEAIIAAVNKSFPIFEDNIKGIFLDNIYDAERVSDLAMRAWLSQYLARIEELQVRFAEAPLIDTQKFNPSLLDVISKLAQDSLRLDQKKPTKQTHDVISSYDPLKGSIVKSTRFQTRLRGPSAHQDVRIQIGDSGNGFRIQGEVGKTSGRSTTLESSADLRNRPISSLTTIGRENPTTAEAKRAMAVLRVLQGADDIFVGNPFMQNILWTTSDTMAWPDKWDLDPSPSPLVDSLSQYENLNSSQILAITRMLSSTPISIIHGPPGTGKTTVIARFVQTVLEAGRGGIWLVAQSNVAVKNIAEKLATVGLADSWRLLISKDFHFDWHEHLYLQIRSNVISSDQFSGSGLQRRMKGCQVILCTLSMLSNHHIHKFTSLVPLQTLVVDEASQIEVGDYISVFSSFESSLRKVCFIGDDKQLPPYGQEEIEDLQSIFEVPHLRKDAVLLDTQYRMPPQIGRLISDAVYNGELNSNPKHPITDTVLACHFIDSGGREASLKTSFINTAEAQVVLQLAEHLQNQNKSYRIITPYDAQRTAIENSMKASDNLNWEDKCFNVDAFQGNEEDFIIISLVRSRAPGFLKNPRRTNVMLTRSKRGMFIVTSQAFLKGAGADSLVGQMAQALEKKWGDKIWLKQADVEAGNF